MKFILASFIVIIFTLGLTVDAKPRLGGGKSTGMQRESVQKDAGTAAKTALPPQATPTAAAAPLAGAAPMAAKTGMSKWLGPLAGLAAGGLLASLFMGHGFDGIKFMDILLVAMLALGAFMLLRAFMRKKAQQSIDGGSTNAIQYVGAGEANRDVSSLPSPAAVTGGGRLIAPEIGSRLAGGVASEAEIEQATRNPRIPADFEISPFERQAHAAFIRLQAANDAGDLQDIRDFSTPEMYAEIALQIQERGTTTQRTEVVALAVTVLEVTTENNRAIASVRYTGTLREGVSTALDTFDEVWHVVKNLADAQSTWRLAGIQQLA